MNDVTIICAHPDDEILGCGGYVQLLKKEKKNISVIFITDGYFKTYKKTLINKKRENAKLACGIVGIKDLFFIGEKGLELDITNKTKLHNKVNKIIKKIQPQILLTHHWGDINKDHKIVFDMVDVLSRPHRSSSIKKVVCFETLSSTEWATRDLDKFNPNFFVALSKENIHLKTLAFEKYSSEVFDAPHPRSKEGIINLAKYRGQIISQNFAESFYILKEYKNI